MKKADQINKSSQHYTVIIPTLNEADWVSKTIKRVQELQPEIEIIVVDGGSGDGTVNYARAAGAKVIEAPRGRGIQCNTGADAASGKILLFLHADTLLPSRTFELLSHRFKDCRVQIGTFRLAFDEDYRLLRLYSKFTGLDSIFTRFGDQCIVIRKSFFDELNGFPDWPLFEDVHFLRAARKKTRIYSFPAQVTTSARRFLKIGIIKTQLINGWLILQYLVGVPSEKLAAQYAGFIGSKHHSTDREASPTTQVGR